MTFQDRGPPEEKAAAGETTDGQDHIACLSLKKAPNKYVETSENASFSIARHVRVLRILKGALASDRNDLWNALTWVLSVFLTERERAAMTFACLRSLDPDEREATVEAAFYDADRPPPLLDEDVMAEARLRAGAMTRRELKAGLTAGWEALDDRERSGFLNRLVGRAGLLRYILQAGPETLDVLGLAIARAMSPARWSELVEHVQKGDRGAA